MGMVGGHALSTAGSNHWKGPWGRLLECWEYSRIWPGSSLCMCVHFLRIHQAIHITFVRFTGCKLTINTQTWKSPKPSVRLLSEQWNEEGQERRGFYCIPFRARTREETLDGRINLKYVLEMSRWKKNDFGAWLCQWQFLSLERTHLCSLFLTLGFLSFYWTVSVSVVQVNQTWIHHLFNAHYVPGAGNLREMLSPPQVVKSFCRGLAVASFPQQSLHSCWEKNSEVPGEEPWGFLPDYLRINGSSKQRRGIKGKAIASKTHHGW